MSDPTPAATPEKATIVDDLIEIWTSPSTVFKRRADSGFFLMMCILTVVIGALFFANRGVLQGVMDAEMNRQFAASAAKGQPVPPEAVAMAKKWAGIIGTFGAFIGVPIGILLVGLGTWLTGKIVGADDEFGYGKATMIASYAFVPKILSMLAVTVQGVLLDTNLLTSPYQLSTSVARFMDPNMNAGVLALLGRVDIFTIWTSVLIGIGIVVVGKASPQKLLPAAAVIWLLGSVSALWQILMGALRGSA
ncbi:MAG: YIP1 family protein [Gemmatimonadetes bacterium]|nr:YIP1 family protein [Gemmatimonadota bacterium]